MGLGRKVILVMGVSGCGKSTIGSLLANELNYTYLEGDDFHPVENIEKMKAGSPLTDSDRLPWLAKINGALREGENIVLACSALKDSYRTQLRKDIEGQFIIVYLHGTYEVIYNRMRARNHFMPSSLLQSQFDTLEIPDDAIKVSIDLAPPEILNLILENI